MSVISRKQWSGEAQIITGMVRVKPFSYVGFVLRVEYEGGGTRYKLWQRDINGVRCAVISRTHRKRRQWETASYYCADPAAADPSGMWLVPTSHSTSKSEASCQ
jgi:hypothetical protein